jgi:hypothetical protein
VTGDESVESSDDEVDDDYKAAAAGPRSGWTVSDRPIIVPQQRMRNRPSGVSTTSKSVPSSFSRTFCRSTR